MAPSRMRVARAGAASGVAVADTRLSKRAKWVPTRTRKRGKTPGRQDYAGWPRQRMRSGRDGTIGWPGTESLLPR